MDGDLSVVITLPAAAAWAFDPEHDLGLRLLLRAARQVCRGAGAISLADRSVENAPADHRHARLQRFATLSLCTHRLLVPSEPSIEVPTLEMTAIACSITVIEDYEGARTACGRQHQPRVAAVEDARTCRP